MKIRHVASTVCLVMLASTGIGLVAPLCMHEKPCASSLPNCVTCTANGPVAGNGGGTCSYQTTKDGLLAFCQCCPNYNCKPGAPLFYDVVSNLTAGTCTSGFCVMCSSGPDSDGWFHQNYAGACPPPGT